MEEEVNYASIVFNNPKTSPPKASREDTIYSTVVVNTQGNEADSAPVTKDKKSANGSNHLLLVFCLGILCVILVSAIIALCVYFTRANGKDKDLITELKELRHDLTSLVEKLTSDIDDLSKDCDNLTNLIGNLSQAYDTLESKSINMTTENLQLRTENINLERQLEDLTREGLNWTLVQWSLDVYCPRRGNSRVCQPCQDGWLHHSSSCYAVNNVQPGHRRSWQKARDDCRAKNSDLTVIDSLQEQRYIYESSWLSSNQQDGFWIGLTSASGRWHWVDGHNLTDTYWITPPGDGQCATSVRDAKPRGWYAVDCTATNQWICEMKALIV